MSDPSQPILGFHLELRVAHLADSTQFYRTLFHREPRATVSEKYSLFEFWDLQLLLLTGKSEKVRFGFQLHSIEQLNLWEKQLTQKEIITKRKQIHYLELGATEIALNITDLDGHHCSFYVLTPQPVPAAITGLGSDSQSS
jgi:hypothetical protein